MEVEYRRANWKEMSSREPEKELDEKLVFDNNCWGCA